MACQPNSQPSSRDNQGDLNNNSEGRLSFQLSKNDLNNVLEHNNRRSDSDCSLNTTTANRTFCDVPLVEQSYRRTPVIENIIKATSTNILYRKSKQEGKVREESIPTSRSWSQDTVAGIDTMGKSLPRIYGSHPFSRTETRQISRFSHQGVSAQTHMLITENFRKFTLYTNSSGGSNQSLSVKCEDPHALNHAQRWEHSTERTSVRESASLSKSSGDKHASGNELYCKKKFDTHIKI